MNDFRPETVHASRSSSHNAKTNNPNRRQSRNGIMQSALADHQQTFHGNSQLMLEKVIEGSPFFLRKRIRSKLMSQLGDGSITEDNLIDAIKQTTPSMFLSKALETAKQYQSKDIEDIDH